MFCTPDYWGELDVFTFRISGPPEIATPKGRKVGFEAIYQYLRQYIDHQRGGDANG